MDGGALRSRVTRAEAAKIHSTSYQNVRRLQRTGQLHSSPDRYGVHRFDRREVETLARKRGMQIKPSGELAARVFQMFEESRRFEDIVIATQQEPETILALWRWYRAGFDDVEGRASREEAERHAHDETLREIDFEFERRRRA